jgi:hypothetical protein
MDGNLEYLIREYKERIDMLQKAVSAGNCQNFEEYRYSCGQIRGLESACLIISDLKQRMESDDQ